MKKLFLISIISFVSYTSSFSQLRGDFVTEQGEILFKIINGLDKPVLITVTCINYFSDEQVNYDPEELAVGDSDYFGGSDDGWVFGLWNEVVVQINNNVCYGWIVRFRPPYFIGEVENPRGEEDYYPNQTNSESTNSYPQSPQIPNQNQNNQQNNAAQIQFLRNQLQQVETEITQTQQDIKENIRLKCSYTMLQVKLNNLIQRKSQINQQLIQLGAY